MPSVYTYTYTLSIQNGGWPLCDRARSSAVAHLRTLIPLEHSTVDSPSVWEVWWRFSNGRVRRSPVCNTWPNDAYIVAWIFRCCVLHVSMHNRVSYRLIYIAEAIARIAVCFKLACLINSQQLRALKLLPTISMISLPWLMPCHDTWSPSRNRTKSRKVGSAQHWLIHKWMSTVPHYKATFSVLCGINWQPNCCEEPHIR